MSIKPDHWIRRMCIEHRMIEPFEEKQVRSGVISYGISSYGYDIRIADEFKIFTNVNSTIVDPKAMDPASMVDFQGPICVIPPNSFALGRSVEYFRVPRTVLCTCLGKSTYARCFRGDTRVALVDGTTATLEDMAARAQRGEWFCGYSLGAFGRIVMTLLETPRFIGRDSLLEVELDNGEKVSCTPDHEFILRNGQEAQACQLRPGQSLMPLYRQLVRGYESVYQPLNGHLEPTHRMADEWNLRHEIYVALAGTHRHHRDGNRANNSPWNIERMPRAEHTRLHNRQSHGEGFDAEEHGLAIRAALARRAEDPQQAGSIRGAARLFGCDRFVFRRFSEEIAAAHGRHRRSDSTNHRVVAVRELPGLHEVYCLTVPEAGNFALAAGVFVRNCGIITNVTPFEPEWEGFVTLEISNTTPLPAKIYSNEGIAQVLFFESDEPCETSYKDKAGKYQKQVGITLPRL